MNATVLWIILPLIVSALLLLLRDENAITLIACVFVFFLTLTAWLAPIDSSLAIGGFTIKIASTLNILGRQLILTSADRSVLVLIYGSSLFWFIPAATLHIARRLIPLGLAIIALLVAALAVDPFLYAALLIETAVLLSIPLLSTPGQMPGKGLIRFLIFQTLAIPFILFSGWILAGVEANPGNLNLVILAGIFLGLGFAFLLAIFPFYTWIPLLAEETHPYILGFVLWILPTVTLLFAAGFLDHYTWLRDTPALGVVLTTTGILMIAAGGIFSAFERQLGKIMGYAVMLETGFSLLALSLVGRVGMTIFLLLLIPRALSVGVWTFSLTILTDQSGKLTLENVKGLARKWPFAATGLVLSNLALAGIPLLAVFPAHQAIWLVLSRSSLPLVLWLFLGSAGLFISAIRVLGALTAAPEGTPWQANERGVQRIILGMGWLALFLLGLFPQWALLLWSKLPVLFEHLPQ